MVRVLFRPEYKRQNKYHDNPTCWINSQIPGCSLLNGFLVLGISEIIYPVRIAPGTGLDLMVNIFASFLLFLFIFTGKGRKIERWEALVFIFAYLLYFVYIIF
ncbi:MAG: hypothetical protein R6U58_04925 [Bacteroidales bacterium]